MRTPKQREKARVGFLDRAQKLICAPSQTQHDLNIAIGGRLVNGEWATEIRMRRSLWICLALAAFTVALYAPALRCQFLAFDDPVYVTENRHVKAGLSLEGLAWAYQKKVLTWT